MYYIEITKSLIDCNIMMYYEKKDYLCAMSMCIGDNIHILRHGEVPESWYNKSDTFEQVSKKLCYRLDG